MHAQKKEKGTEIRHKREPDNLIPKQIEHSPQKKPIMLEYVEDIGGNLVWTLQVFLLLCVILSSSNSPLTSPPSLAFSSPLSSPPPSFSSSVSVGLGCCMASLFGEASFSLGGMISFWGELMFSLLRAALEDPFLGEVCCTCWCRGEWYGWHFNL